MSNFTGVAHAEWSKRKPDETFGTLEAMHAAVEARTKRAIEAIGVSYADLRVEAEGKEMFLVGKKGIPARFTNWAFGQISRAVKAPAAFLRELPATLAAQVLNNRLAVKGGEVGECKLLLDSGDFTPGQEGMLANSRSVRAFTGKDYSRIWDREITERLIGLQSKGWQPAPETDLPKFEQDCPDCKVLHGKPNLDCDTCEGKGVVLAHVKTRGLYASDHDVFAFMVDNERRIFEKAPGGGLSRGFIVANSEVGDKSFWVLSFLYSFVCSNHNIWGMEGVSDLRVVHRGEANAKAFGELEVRLKAYGDAAAGEDEAKILRCRAKELGKDKEEVLDKIFGMKSVGLSRTILDAAYDAAEVHESWYLAAPTSAWGLGNGITEVARGIEHADSRVEVEKAAGKVFEMGF